MVKKKSAEIVEYFPNQKIKSTNTSTKYVLIDKKGKFLMRINPLPVGFMEFEVSSSMNDALFSSSIHDAMLFDISEEVPLELLLNRARLRKVIVVDEVIRTISLQ